MAEVLLRYVLMFALSKILVPSDFGPRSGAALEYALGLAATTGASVTVFHAYEIPVIGVPDGTFVATPEMVGRIRASAEHALEVTVREHTGEAPLDSLLREGRPWEAILEAAREIGADLIVMGTHGRHGFVRALLGSVTEKVVRTSAIPVLVVHFPATSTERDVRPRGSADASVGRSFG